MTCPDIFYNNCRLADRQCEVCRAMVGDGELLYTPRLYYKNLKVDNHPAFVKPSKVVNATSAVKKKQQSQGRKEEDVIKKKLRSIGQVNKTIRSGAEYHDGDLTLRLNGRVIPIEVKKRTTERGGIIRSDELIPKGINVTTLHNGRSYAIMELSLLLTLLEDGSQKEVIRK